MNSPYTKSQPGDGILTYSIVRKRAVLRASINSVFTTLLLTLPLCAGCSKRYSDVPPYFPFRLGDYENQSVGRFKTSYIADQIDDYFRGTDPGPVGVTTFVNLEDLYTTSSFGRLCGEQLMSELAMRGYEVVELRHADAINFLNPDGEFGLSREASSVKSSRKLGAVLVGTYSASPERVYVNVRLIDPASSIVLSAASVEMGRTKELSKLLRGGGMPSSLERVPVRHLSMFGTASTPSSPTILPEQAQSPVSTNRPTAPRPNQAILKSQRY